MGNSDSDNDSRRLPLRKWVFLADAEELVASLFGCSHEDAREFIVHAIKDGVTRLRGYFEDAPNDRLYLEIISVHRMLNSKLDWQDSAIHFHEPFVIDPNSSWTYDEARDVEVEIQPLLELSPDHRGDPIAKGSKAIDQSPLGEGERGTDHAVDNCKSGYPGRPTISHHVLKEFRRRIAVGEAFPTLKREAEALRAWAIEAHSDAPVPTTGTIENQIRSEYRKIFPLKP
ncbi:MAG: hypothetical protein O7I42_17380 [Alphaproteobacteria bacterium]|nr:hypothetical protein [Alphaproteobacteria bacterium]